MFFSRLQKPRRCRRIFNNSQDLYFLEYKSHVFIVLAGHATYAQVELIRIQIKKHVPTEGARDHFIV